MTTSFLLLAALAANPHAPAKPKDIFKPAPVSSFIVGPMPGRPVVADLNKDSKVDIVVACGPCCGSPEDPASGHLVTLLGKGDGTFTRSGEALKVGRSARKVALGDVNGDGWLDAAVAEHNTYKISILLGNGKGFDAAKTSVQCGSGARPHVHDVALADLNGDKKLDILTTNPNDHVVGMLAGDGKGGFAHLPGSPSQLGSHPYDAIGVADMNKDGHPDVVLPDLAAKRISVTFGDGTGQFTKERRTLTTVDDRPGYLTVVDVNSDGSPDVVATHDDVPLVDVLINDGKGNLSRAGPIKVQTPGGFCWGVAAGDVSQDGRIDLVLGLAGGKGVVVLLGDGKGGFKQDPAGPYPADEGSDHVALGDFDGNGTLDIVTGNYKAGTLSVLLNNVAPRR